MCAGEASKARCAQFSGEGWGIWLYWGERFVQQLCFRKLEKISQIIPQGIHFKPLRTEQEKLILNKTSLLHLLEGRKIESPLI